MRNHFVPQFLQKPWTTRDPEGRLHVFRLSRRGLETYRQTPKGNGYIDDLLSLTRETVAGMDRHAIEKVVLEAVDNEAASVRRKMEVDGLKSLTHRDRVAWARFIMSLQLRQPNIVLQLRADAAQQLRETLANQPGEYDALVDDAAEPTLEAWTEARFPGAIENFGLSFFHELLDNEDVGNKILRLKWWLWDFSGCSHHLLLGDRPCIFAGGIDHPDLAIVLPISPTKAFIATRGERTADAMRQQTTRRLIGRLNDATVAQAVERIFARDESPLCFIRNRRPRLEAPPQAEQDVAAPAEVSGD